MKRHALRPGLNTLTLSLLSSLTLLTAAVEAARTRLRRLRLPLHPQLQSQSRHLIPRLRV